MRVIGLMLVVAIASFGSVASAEKVKTNQEAKLFNHPGEQGAVLLHLKEGETMTLVGEEGRWLKVRVHGRTGFIPRSKVDMPDTAEIARNTRRRPFVDGRGTKRGFDTSAGPDDRVGADALGETSTKDADDAKKPSKGDDDDDDDTAKKPVKKVVAKKPAPKGDDDDDDDDTAKKPAKKPVVAKKRPSKGDDDDDDDDTAKKPAAKPAKKVVATKSSAKKSGDDDDDDDDDDAKGGKKSAKAAAKKTSGDDDDDAAPKADKRPSGHVEAKSKIFEERSAKSSVAFVAKPGDKLYIDSTKGDWTTVENDDGDTGWILSSDLLVDSTETAGPAHSTIIDANARAGVSFIQQTMKTTGSSLSGTDQVPDAYSINASAATIAIGADLLYPMSKKLYLGGEATYAGSKTVGGGIVYNMIDTGFTIHDINIRALAAYDLQRPSGMMLIGHLGLRYRAYLVNGYGSVATNPAKIPQETLEAPTIGAALAMPNLGANYGLQFGLDMILFGSSISQTKGYEDGATPSMKDVEANARFVYRLSPSFDFLATYDLDLGFYNFGAPPADSMRGHTGMDVTRNDLVHQVTVGVVKGF
ncbi:MAG TPA: SH3 domain-containing protein [Kofleriaceae bacterium]